MSVTMRKIKWREGIYRPAAMPSVACPRVHHVGGRGYGTDWLACTHCLACAYLRGLTIDAERRGGEVACAAPDEGTDA